MKKRRMRRRGDAGRWTIKLAQMASRAASRRRRTNHPLRGTWLRIVRASRDPDPSTRIPAPQRWLDFAQFLRDVGPRPEGCRLVRPFAHLGWRPANAVWVRRADVNHEGFKFAARVLGIPVDEARLRAQWLTEHPVAEIPPTSKDAWGGLKQKAKDAGVNYRTLQKRLRLGWTLEEALVPPQQVGTGTGPATDSPQGIVNTESTNTASTGLGPKARG